MQVLKFNGTQIKNIHHLAHLVDCKQTAPSLFFCSLLLFHFCPHVFVILISMQEQIFSFRVWRQLPCCAGERSSECFFILHSQRLWNPIWTIFRSIGAICGFIERQPSCSSGFWQQPNFKSGNWLWWTPLGMIPNWEVNLSWALSRHSIVGKYGYNLKRHQIDKCHASAHFSRSLHELLFWCNHMIMVFRSFHSIILSFRLVGWAFPDR